MVDDEEMFAEMLYGILRQHHYTTDMVTDPQEAVQMIIDDDYQLVVTDYQMPGLTGVQLVEKIREAGLSIPIIIISGMMHTPELQRAVNMGITSVLQKPTVTSAFLSHVNKYLPKAAVRDVESLSSDFENDEVAASTATSSLANKVFTYPAHIKHLSAYSESTKRSLQAMWDASRSLNQLFMRVPRGGDALQFAMELSNWKGFDEVPLHFVNVAEIESKECKKQLDELSVSNKQNEVVIVDCQNPDLRRFIDSLTQHIKTAHFFTSGSRELTFVYWFSHASWDSFLGLMPDGIRRFCDSQVVDIPPLSERLPDLAEYATMLTQRFARKFKLTNRHEFTAEAINILLTNEWPGNFSELTLALRMVVGSGEDLPISAEDLSKCISGEALEMAHSEQKSKGIDHLKSFLHSIQNRFIETASSDATMQLASAYSAEDGLLFPELASPDAGPAA